MSVVSCKSQLTDIDKDYPSSLKKYGVKKVFLFAECCAESSLQSLKLKARRAGYKGLWFLYSVVNSTGLIKNDELELIDFGDEVFRNVSR